MRRTNLRSTSNCEFSQYNKVKNRDKGYQHLDEEFKCPLSQRDIFEMLSYKEEVDTADELNEADYKTLYQAFLLLKSVPRQSNRTKWKENAGFAPQLLMEVDGGDKFCVGDMVFSKDVHGYLKQHIVAKEFMISSLDDMFEVTDVTSGATDILPITSLVLDRGLYAVLPFCYFEYSPEKGLSMSDVGSQYV